MTLGSGRALAWEEAPLCALEPPPRLLSLPTEAPLEPEPAMCRPEAQTTRHRVLDEANVREAWTRA